MLDAVYERTPEQIAMAIEMLLNHQHLMVQDSDVVAAATESDRRRPSFGFSDYLVLEIARKADICHSVRSIGSSRRLTTLCACDSKYSPSVSPSVPFGTEPVNCPTLPHSAPRSAKSRT